MKIKDQIDTLGHAQVLVVLKRKVTKRVEGRLQLMASATQEARFETAKKLMPHFKTFPNSRAAIISQEAFQESARPALPTQVKRRAPTPAGYDSGGGVALNGRVDDIAASGNPLSVRYFPRLGVLLGTVDKVGLIRLLASGEISALSSPPEFSLIHPQSEYGGVALNGIPTGESWGLQQLRIPELWQAGLTGAGVLVGHLDTGVDSSHGALRDAVDVFAEFDHLGIQVAGAAARDTGFHGTHTAGLIAGRDFNGSRFGAAPGAKLACAVVIEKGNVPARVISGMDWCVEQGCRIINLSLGIQGYDPSFTAILSFLRQLGILTVAAVGNEGPLTSRSPGNYRQVISVGACDAAGGVWWSSSSNVLPGTPAVAWCLIW